MPEDTFRGDDNGYACMTVEGGGRSARARAGRCRRAPADAGGGGGEAREDRKGQRWGSATQGRRSTDKVGRWQKSRGTWLCDSPASGLRHLGHCVLRRGGARGGEERDGGASAHGALPASRPPACCRGALSPTLPPIHRPAAPRRAPSRRSAENEQVDRDLH